VNHKRDRTIIQVPSVPVVKSNNNSMGGVDLHDQLRAITMSELSLGNGGAIFSGFVLI